MLQHGYYYIARPPSSAIHSLSSAIGPNDIESVSFSRRTDMPAVEAKIQGPPPLRIGWTLLEMINVVTGNVHGGDKWSGPRGRLDMILSIM